MAMALNMYSNHFSEFNAVDNMRRNNNTFANVGQFEISKQISSSDSSGSSPPFHDQNKPSSPGFRNSRPGSSSSSIGYRTRSSSITVPSQTPLTIVSTPPLSENDSKSPPIASILEGNEKQGLNPNAKEYKFPTANSAPFYDNNSQNNPLNHTAPSFHPTQSSPNASSPPLTTKTVSNLYKTELCRSQMETGLCRYGTKCQFAHGMAELRSVSRHPKYKTDLCRSFHTTGTCPYGNRCHFIHSPQRPNFEAPSSSSEIFDKNNVWSDRTSMAEKLRPKPKDERSHSVCNGNIFSGTQIWSNDITEKSWENAPHRNNNESPVSWDIGWPLNEQNSIKATVNAMKPSSFTKKSLFNNNSLFSNTSSSGIWDNSRASNENTFSSIFAESLSFNEKQEKTQQNCQFDPFGFSKKSNSQPAFDIFSSIYDDAEKNKDSHNKTSSSRLPVFEQLTADTF